MLISVLVCSNCQDPPLSALTQLNLNTFVTPSTDRGKSAEGNTELKIQHLTPCISKVAEEFVVDDFVKPAVMNILHDNQ